MTIRRRTWRPSRRATREPLQRRLTIGHDDRSARARPDHLLVCQGVAEERMVGMDVVEGDVGL